MYFHSLSATLVAVTGVLPVRKRLAVNYHHRIAHPGWRAAGLCAESQAIIQTSGDNACHPSLRSGYGLPDEEILRGVSPERSAWAQDDSQDTSPLQKQTEEGVRATAVVLLRAAGPDDEPSPFLVRGVAVRQAPAPCSGLTISPHPDHLLAWPGSRSSRQA